VPDAQYPTDRHPVLVDISRDGFVESHQRGSLVLLAPDGAARVAAGDVTSAILARSALKPLQALAMVEAGFPGRGRPLALAAASHDGEQQHIDGVRAILDRAGLDESGLLCPPRLPAGPDALVAWIRSGGAASAVCNECSGKHAAMLATCLAAGWPGEEYTDPAHPLQRAIRDRIETLTGQAVTRHAIDGCGTPAFAVSLSGLARAFAKLAAASTGAGYDVARSMRGHPELVSGTGRAGAELTREVPGLVCKSGAEGVWGAALADGRAFAAKLDDGADRGQPALLAAVLRHWGFDGAAVRRWSNVPIFGGDRSVGAVTASAQLHALLDPR